MVLIKMLYYLKDKGTFLLTKMLHLQVLLSHEKAVFKEEGAAYSLWQEWQVWDPH